MSYNNFFWPDSGYSATPTEDLDNALRESGIPKSDLANALTTRRQARELAPLPSTGVTKARQAAPAGRKARKRKAPGDQASKRISKACVHCRDDKLKCGGEKPSCGRCSGKGKFCRYGCTEKEETVQRVAAIYARREEYALGIAASAPEPRSLQPRLEGPITALGELAAAPVLSPPYPEQINQSYFQPVQSTADLWGSDRFTATQCTPSNYTPTDCAPTDYTPTYYTPNIYTSIYQTPSYQTPSYQTPSYQTPNYQTPNYQTPSYPTPTQVAPIQLDPAQIGQNQFDPNNIDGTLGNWTPTPNFTPQYSPLESLPDEWFQHPQESQFAPREVSQLPSGPLQFREGLGFTNGAQTDQPDRDLPYLNHSSPVYPNVPAGAAWSNSDFPAQGTPRWPDNFGLESMDNAQMPSPHVERVRSLADIPAMMAPREDWWA